MNFEKGAADVAGSDRGSILFIQFVEPRPNCEGGDWKKAKVGNIIPHQTVGALLQARNHMSLRADGRTYFPVSTRDLHTHVARVFQEGARRKGCLPLTCHEIYGSRLQLEKFAAALVAIIFVVNVLFMSLATRLLLERTLHISMAI